MNKFRFRVADYKKISRALFLMMIILIPLLLITVFIFSFNNSVFSVLIGLGFVFSAVLLYFGLMKYYLIYDSEFIVDERGITERNLKTGKIQNFDWNMIDSFKYTDAKHTIEPKEYLKITFKNSTHTITVSEFTKDRAKINNLVEFRNQIEKYL